MNSLQSSRDSSRLSQDASAGDERLAETAGAESDPAPAPPDGGSHDGPGPAGKNDDPGRAGANDDGELATDDLADSAEQAEQAEDTEPAEQAEDPEAVAKTTRSARRWLVAVLALAFVLTLLLVCGGLLLNTLLSHRATDARREAILSVARDVAQVSYSLDYESFPQQAAKIISETSGNYRQGMINSQQGLQYILTEGKVKSTCAITAAGIERDDDNTATVLLSITSQVTNTEVKVPQTRVYRVSMSLERQGDRWLVAGNDVIA
jgi:Mce-associated membrane protein